MSFYFHIKSTNYSAATYHQQNNKRDYYVQTPLPPLCFDRAQVIKDMVASKKDTAAVFIVNSDFLILDSHLFGSFAVHGFGHGQ